MKLTNPTSQPTPAEAALIPKARAETSPGDWLIATLGQYGFVLPANAIEWRAKRVKGSLPSLSIHSATLLATDNIVAYFVLGDDTTLFYGHLAAFEPDKEEKEPKPRKERKLSPRQQLLASL